MADHHDFNPNGPRAPKIPRNAERWDFSNIWSASAHLRFYDFYFRSPAWVWADGSSAEWAFLGGAFLLDVQGQSQVQQEMRRVRNRARALAQSLCGHLREGETNTFADRGYALVRADVGSTNVALSLGRFSLYWELDGRIGPKRRRPGGGWRAFWRASIKYTIYDFYDFGWYVIVGSLPELVGAGHPYHMRGVWDGVAGGVVTCAGVPEEEDDDDEDGQDNGVSYTLGGGITLINDCDGEVGSLPDQVQILTRLESARGGVDAEATAAVFPDPADPTNPQKTGTYSVTVKWDEALGSPTRWTMPRMTRPDGSPICGSIPCDEGRCMNMATRPRFIPFADPATSYDLRSVCSCIGK